MMFAPITTTAACLLVLINPVKAKSNPQFLELPSNQEWTSLTERVDFLPVPDEGSPLLRHAQRRFLSYYSDHFVDGQETQYNDYAQAWRLLGLYVDCDAAAEERRRLEDGADDADENADEQEQQDNGNEEEDQEEEQQNDEEQVEEEENDGDVCERRLLWAAVSS